MRNHVKRRYRWLTGLYSIFQGNVGCLRGRPVGIGFASTAWTLGGLNREKVLKWQRREVETDEVVLGGHVGGVPIVNRGQVARRERRHPVHDRMTVTSTVTSADEAEAVGGAEDGAGEGAEAEVFGVAGFDVVEYGGGVVIGTEAGGPGVDVTDDGAGEVARRFRGLGLRWLLLKGQKLELLQH
ncbi:unnamed protein product [Allacma fusca]|uniref:Uncharacterized protein n=1 Tax=Allacma fusca TaxID=39272 RepID=A0A8J2KSY5_9HEXA|nr:unnamed protein product [Allacma fusca]